MTGMMNMLHLIWIVPMCVAIGFLGAVAVSIWEITRDPYE